VFGSQKIVNPLKSRLRRKGVTYVQIVEKLEAVGISNQEVIVANKLSRGKFSAAFMLACLKAIQTEHLHLE
jgi:3-mercaptopyruvate sulfurtransferase SseA